MRNSPRAFVIATRRRTARAIALCAGALWSYAAHAQAAEPLDARIAAVADQEFAAAVAAGRSSAAVAIFVHNGSVQFAKGYGWEDAARRAPITPADSVFDLASISKTFTALAIAHLKSDGAIASFNDPVNRYLRSYRLPDSFGRPIAIRDLATHTAGFDQVAFGLNPAASGPAEYVRARAPRYFRPPGAMPAYSGYGATVLRLLVSDARGADYLDVLKRDVFEPLGMSHTQAGALDATGLAHQVVAFEPAARYQPGTERSVEAEPFHEGLVYSTAEDMGRYMLALLGEGETALSAGLRADLFNVLQQDGEFGAAHALIFEILRLGDHRMFTHAAFGSDVVCYLALDPMKRAGLFYCFTVFKPRLAATTTLRPLDHAAVKASFLKAMAADVPYLKDPASTMTEWRPQWGVYIGNYLSLSRHFYGVGRLRSLLHSESIAVVRGQRGLKIAGEDGFAEVSPGAFRAAGVPDTYQFSLDPYTRQWTLSGNILGSTFQKPSFGDNPRVLLPLLGAVLLAGMSGLLLPLWPRGVSLRAKFAGFGYAGVLAAGVGALFGLHAFGDRYYQGIAWPINLVRILAWLSIPLTLQLLAGTLRAWRTGAAESSRISRLHLTLLALCACATLPLFWEVGLLSLAAPR